MFYPTVASICNFFTTLLTRMKNAAFKRADKEKAKADALRFEANAATNRSVKHAVEGNKADNAIRNIKKLFDE